MDWLRSCYPFTFRLTPGGRLIRGRWYWAAPDAEEYDKTHRFFAWSQWLQLENRSDDPKAVGELTKGPGIGASTLKPKRRGNKQRRKKSSWEDGERPEGADGQDGVHGTPAAFLGERELDGTFYAKVWDPDEITREEFEALPECIRLKWESRITMFNVAPTELILESRFDEVFADIGYEPEILLETIMEDGSETHEDCYLLGFDEDGIIGWDEDSPIEVECPAEETVMGWTDDDPLGYDEDAPIGV